VHENHAFTPFDPDWLDSIARFCAARPQSERTLVDLYLERRFELTVSSSPGFLQMEQTRSEGSAVRWSHPSRLVLCARSGVAPEVIHSLLDLPRNASDPSLPHPAPHTELEAPDGWREWAQKYCVQVHPRKVTVRFLARTAAVIRAGKWTIVNTPPLLRIVFSDPPEASLLAVWGHPKIGEWMGELAEPAPTKQWVPASGGELPVVFRNGTAGVLMHELVGHMLETDLEAGERSVFKGLEGATVAPPSTFLIDDPTRSDLPGAFSADDEGFPGHPILLLEAGRPVGALSDRASATRFNLQPGRGRRSSWTCPPQPRISNLVLAPGSTSPESLEAEQQKGLVVTRLAGAIVDPVSTRVVLRVERGWELHNGRRRRALGTCELTGTVLQLLAAIDPTLADDPTPDWRLGWCLKDGRPMPTGSCSPTILVRSLRVL
jgi:hypothetical protein